MIENASKTLKEVDALLAKGIKNVGEFIELLINLVKQYGRLAVSLYLVAFIYNKYLKNIVVFLFVTTLLYIIFTFIKDTFNIINIPKIVFYSGCYVLYLLGVSK